MFVTRNDTQNLVFSFSSSYASSIFRKATDSHVISHEKGNPGCPTAKTKWFQSQIFWLLVLLDYKTYAMMRLAAITSNLWRARWLQYTEYSASKWVMSQSFLCSFVPLAPRYIHMQPKVTTKQPFFLHPKSILEHIKTKLSHQVFFYPKYARLISL